MFSRILDLGNRFGYQLAKALGEAEVEPGILIDLRKSKEGAPISHPLFQSILPYDNVNPDHIFINTSTIGFGLYIAPGSGADIQRLKAHANLIKHRLPDGFDLSVLMFKHQFVANDLFRGFKDILKKGGIYASIAEMSIRYHVNAVKRGYKNKRNLPAALCDYQVFMFVSAKSKKVSHDALMQVRISFESELQVMGYGHTRLTVTDFVTLMRVITSPIQNEIEWPNVQVDASQKLSVSLVKPKTEVLIQDAHIDFNVLNDEGEPQHTRVVNLAIDKWPEKFVLWSQPDLYANVFNPDKGIQCPFLISFTVRGSQLDANRSEAKSKSESLAKGNNAVQRMLNPRLTDEISDWSHGYQEISKGNMSLHDTFYNIVLFTNKEDSVRHVAQAIAAYREFGFEVSQQSKLSFSRYLASLPFFLSEGYFEDLKFLNQTKRLNHYACANQLPLIADFKGSPKGMLLPTYRHQLAYVDTFDGKSLPISNYNFVTVGSPGSGKSLLNQWRILNGLASGEKIFVLDLGDSYKHLCELVGGTYINAANIALNPFTLFDFDGEVEIEGKVMTNHSQIRDLLAIMASPHTPISGIQNDYLLEAVIACHRQFGNQTCIDNVLVELTHMNTQHPNGPDSRLNDLIVHLKKFGKEGMYGHMFNSATPFLANPDFVVLEMGEFENNPDLLTIIMFVMIVVIQGQFYHTDRNRRKLCIIDEAWRFLVGNFNPIAARFIEQGFRTARKYNAAFGVIFQQIGDLYGSLQGQAIAASSDIKFILRQGNFEHYIKENPNAFDERQVRLIRDFGEAGAQGFSNVLVQYGNAYTFHRYFADPFTRVLFSSNAEEFFEIETLMQSGLSLADAVLKVAESRYGDELCEA
jgi:conjugal transfer ATP-binding protein TraC